MSMSPIMFQPMAVNSYFSEQNELRGSDSRTGPKQAWMSEWGDTIRYITNAAPNEYEYMPNAKDLEHSREDSEIYASPASDSGSVEICLDSSFPCKNKMGTTLKGAEYTDEDSEAEAEWLPDGKDDTIFCDGAYSGNENSATDLELEKIDETPRVNLINSLVDLVQTVASQINDGTGWADTHRNDLVKSMLDSYQRNNSGNSASETPRLSIAERKRPCMDAISRTGVSNKRSASKSVARLHKPVIHTDDLSHNRRPVLKNNEPESGDNESQYSNSENSALRMRKKSVSFAETSVVFGKPETPTPPPGRRKDKDRIWLNIVTPKITCKMSANTLGRRKEDPCSHGPSKIRRSQRSTSILAPSPTLKRSESSSNSRISQRLGKRSTTEKTPVSEHCALDARSKLKTCNRISRSASMSTARAKNDHMKSKSSRGISAPAGHLSWKEARNQGTAVGCSKIKRNRQEATGRPSDRNRAFRSKNQLESVRCDCLPSVKAKFNINAVKSVASRRLLQRRSISSMHCPNSLFSSNMSQSSRSCKRYRQVADIRSDDKSLWRSHDIKARPSKSSQNLSKPTKTRIKSCIQGTKTSILKRGSSNHGLKRHWSEKESEQTRACVPGGSGLRNRSIRSCIKDGRVGNGHAVKRTCASRNIVTERNSLRHKYGVSMLNSKFSAAEVSDSSKRAGEEKTPRIKQGGRHLKSDAPLDLVIPKHKVIIMDYPSRQTTDFRTLNMSSLRRLPDTARGTCGRKRKRRKSKSGHSKEEISFQQKEPTPSPTHIRLMTPTNAEEHLVVGSELNYNVESCNTKAGTELQQAVIGCDTGMPGDLSLCSGKNISSTTDKATETDLSFPMPTGRESAGDIRNKSCSQAHLSNNDTCGRHADKYTPDVVTQLREELAILRRMVLAKKRHQGKQIPDQYANMKHEALNLKTDSYTGRKCQAFVMDSSDTYDESSTRTKVHSKDKYSDGHFLQDVPNATPDSADEITDAFEETITVAECSSAAKVPQTQMSIHNTTDNASLNISDIRAVSLDVQLRRKDAQLDRLRKILCAFGQKHTIDLGVQSTNANAQSPGLVMSSTKLDHEFEVQDVILMETKDTLVDLNVKCSHDYIQPNEDNISDSYSVSNTNSESQENAPIFENSVQDCNVESDPSTKSNEEVSNETYFDYSSITQISSDEEFQSVEIDTEYTNNNNHCSLLNPRTENGFGCFAMSRGCSTRSYGHVKACGHSFRRQRSALWTHLVRFSSFVTCATHLVNQKAFACHHTHKSSFLTEESTFDTFQVDNCYFGNKTLNSRT